MNPNKSYVIYNPIIMLVINWLKSVQEDILINYMEKNINKL